MKRRKENSHLHSKKPTTNHRGFLELEIHLLATIIFRQELSMDANLWEKIEEYHAIYKTSISSTG